jgi:hypothetical protein
MAEELVGSRSISPERLETLVLARLSMYSKPPDETALARALRSYAPSTFDEAPWRAVVSDCVRDLHDRHLVTTERRPLGGDELLRRIGPHAARHWEHWSDRILPALALGIAADDTRSHKRLARAGGWPAAIAGRALDLWTDGPPPTQVALCDALTWRELGLRNAPRECPAAIRAHFLHKHVAGDAGPPDRLLRRLAAQVAEAPRPELDAIRAGLVRRWLTGRELAPGASLVDAVRTVAHRASEGVFGDRKVFISSVWHALRANPPWSALALDDFKTQLLAAHRNRQVELARADLVAAMDPALVAASETRADGATFHFIVREAAR